MKKSGIMAVVKMAVVLLVAQASVTHAEVKIGTERIDNEKATADFKFKTVPAPTKTNAAIGAKLTIVDGDKDDAAGELDVLHDGKLPTEQDEPAGNFFFNAGSEGGRFVMDLGKAIDVKQINSYSWHTDTRAPQVYTVYGADGTADKFNSAPKGATDPATVGWTLIAKVDTKPKTGEPGGQYGVSLSDDKGNLGKFRYLLFVVSRTESDDDFGNTFYSEINVIDGNEGMKDATPGAAKEGVKVVEIDGGKYSATIDTTETPDLTDWADKQLSPVVVEWYPKLVDMLPSDGYEAPKHFSITFRKDKQGVADTGGTRINCAADFFRNELDKQAKGAILHEMVHVVQQYGIARKTNAHPNPNPGWLVEGIPDYIRWYKFEPQSHGTAISKRGLAKANYDGSYRITANFLDYTINKYDKNLVEEMDAAMRQGKYEESLWKKYTGKTVQELNDEWKAGLEKSLGVTTAATAN